MHVGQHQLQVPKDRVHQVLNRPPPARLHPSRCSTSATCTTSCTMLPLLLLALLLAGL
jgi:hypothetical protein